MSEQKHTARFEADNRDLIRKTDQVETRMQRLSRTIKTLAGTFITAFSVKAMVNFFATSAKAYDEQAKASASLLVALKGRKDIQEDIIKQASELQSKTLFGDEQTIEAASRMAMILGTNKKAIMDLMPLVQDLASAKFEGNLAVAADMVAKSVGSSTNALSRYGIQIEGTVGSAERLESAMRELNRQVGGQAAIAAETGLGPLKQLANAFGDLKEVIGEAIVEAEGFQQTIKDLKETTEGTAQFFSEELVDATGEPIKGFKKLLTWFGLATGSMRAAEKVVESYAYKQEHANEFIEEGAKVAKVYQEAISRIAAPAGAGFEQLKASIEGLADLSKLQETTIVIDDIAQKLTLAQEAAIMFADEMIRAGVESKGSMLDFARTAVMVAKKVIATYIAEGVAAAVKKALTSVPFPFNLAAAGIAGGAAAALFNSIIPNFAYGGAAYGPTMALVGEAPGISRANPEYIGTAKQLSQMGMGGGKLTARVSRGDLLFILNEAETSNNRNY